ncbi:sigma-54-dependent Fis family transcriptional regulator [bacterium]|nr:sigma-54-dependent Fis family transcriptional regulator [bacterium]
MSAGKILVVDDERKMRETLRAILEQEGYEVLLAQDGEHAVKVCDASVSVVITDAKMPNMDGTELLRHLGRTYPDVPGIMITAFDSSKLAVEAMKAGARDYFSKPFDPERVLIVVRKIVEHQRVLTENARLKGRLGRRFDVKEIVGDSPEMREIIHLVTDVASTPSSVLIEGDSGTGKELIARALHFLGKRRNQPFLTVNCAAIPDTLLEAELFGYRKGSFTDAIRDKPGRFEEADGGTLFLDEIGDMSLALQAKILRVLQEKEFTKIGDVQPIRVDVRIIAATNKNLPEEIRRARFREDLYYRINVISIKVPTLLQRIEDLPDLVEFFLRKFNFAMGRQIEGLTEEAMALLTRHPWPGNVRELENVIERAVILTKGQTVQAETIRDSLPLRRGREPRGVDEFIDEFCNGDDSYANAVEAFERRLIAKALKSSGGALSKAARQLNISRHALRYRMQKLAMQATEEEKL